MKNHLLLFPLLLLFAEMSVYLSNDMYLPALTALMKDLGANLHQTQYTLTAWFLGAASMQLLVGPLSDRMGRRPILIAGMILFVGSTLLCTLASNIFVFILARFIQGSTVCYIVVAGYASIHELFDQKKAVHLLALMNSILVLAPAFGPFLGGLVLLVASWRWIFGILVILGMIVLGSLLKWMPEPLPPDQRHPLDLKIIFKQYLAILSNTRFQRFILPYCLIFCGFIAWLVSGPFFVIKQFHYQPMVFGFCQIYIFGIYILANYQVKTLMEKLGIHRLIELGLVISLAGSLLSFFLAIVAPASLSGLVLGASVFSFGFGCSSAPLQRLAIEASREPMGARMAIVSSFLGLFGLLSTLLVALFYNGQLLSLASIFLGTSLLAGFIFSRA